MTQGSAATRYLYDGDQRAAEFDASGAVLRRTVFGSGMDEPLVWIEGSGWTTAAKRWLVADERGSVIAVTDSAGDPVSGGINSYDEYGIPGAGNTGAFQYTGQAWLPELGLYYYKARFYSPTLGRFMQTDPIGYDSGMNFYAYVGGDPVNGSDPSGLKIPNYCTGSIIPRDTCGGVNFLSINGVDAAAADMQAMLAARDGASSYSAGGVNYIYNCVGLPQDGYESCGLRVIGYTLSGFSNSIWNFTKSLLCASPPLAAGGGLDAYAGVGGSVGSAASVNPRNGQISISIDDGVGFGVGGGGRVSTGKFIGLGKGSSESLPLFGGGANINATAVAGAVGATGSYQFLGSNKGDWGAGYTGGAEVSGNVNVSVHAQINIPPLYNLGCSE